MGIQVRPIETTRRRWGVPTPPIMIVPFDVGHGSIVGAGLPCAQDKSMMVRIWRTGFDHDRKRELIDFANEVSLPLLSSREGNRDVMFCCDGDQWLTMTMWDNQQAIDRLEADAEYQGLVSAIPTLGVLRGDQSVEVFHHEGGATWSRSNGK